MGKSTLARHVRDLGSGFSKFEELDPVDTVSNVFRSQTPTCPHLDVLVQIPVSSKWQGVNRHYHSANLVPAPHCSLTTVDAVGKCFMRLFVPSEYPANIVVVISFFPPSTATGQREPDSSIRLQVTN